MSELGTLSVQRIDGGYLVNVHGKATFQHSHAFRDFVARSLECGARVVVDLNGCLYLDSTILGCMAILHRRAKADGADFAISADPPVLEKLLKPTRLDQLLELADPPPTPQSTPVQLPGVDSAQGEFGQLVCDAHRALAELGGPAADTFRRIADDLSRELGC